MPSSETDWFEGKRDPRKVSGSVDRVASTGPAIPNVSLKFVVEHMRHELHHYFSSYDEHIQGAINAAADEYLQSSQFQHDIREAVLSAIRRRIEVEASVAVSRATESLRSQMEAAVQREAARALKGLS